MKFRILISFFIVNLISTSAYTAHLNDAIVFNIGVAVHMDINLPTNDLSSASLEYIPSFGYGLLLELIYQIQDYINIGINIDALVSAYFNVPILFLVGYSSPYYFLYFLAGTNIELATYKTATQPITSLDICIRGGVIVWSTAFYLEINYLRLLRYPEDDALIPKDNRIRILFGVSVNLLDNKIDMVE